MKMKALGLHHKKEGHDLSKDTVLIEKGLSLYILCNGVGEGPSASRTGKETAHLFVHYVKEQKIPAIIGERDLLAEGEKSPLYENRMDQTRTLAKLAWDCAFRN